MQYHASFNFFDRLEGEEIQGLSTFQFSTLIPMGRRANRIAKLLVNLRQGANDISLTIKMHYALFRPSTDTADR
jgi:hypothetical protein